MLLSPVFIACGIRSAARDRNVVTSKQHPGVYVLVGFGLLAMGSPVFLLGVFRFAL